MISRNQIVFRKISANKKGEVKGETVYPSANGKYLTHHMYIISNKISERAHQLSDYVFEDNDDILSKKKCHHIDKFTWNNKNDNIRWATSTESKLKCGSL
jgi:hypothetical protein